MAKAVVFGCAGYSAPKYGMVGSSWLGPSLRFFRLVAGSNLSRTAGVLGVKTARGALGCAGVGVGSVLTADPEACGRDDDVGGGGCFIADKGG